MRLTIPAQFSRLVIMSDSIFSTPKGTAARVLVRPACRAALGVERLTLNNWLVSHISRLMLILVLCGTIAVAANAADLTVRVDGLHSAKGTVLLELDDSVAGWDNKVKPLATGSVKAAMGEVTYTFKNLPPGTYAVGVIDDENDNGKLDTNFLGIPKEGYGFSNNVTAMRKPTFDEAHVDVGQQDASILIHLAHAL
jgi:uncharacterized protein (DUF2141 family)